MDATKEDIPMTKTTNLDDEKKLETFQTQKSSKKKVTIVAVSEEVHSANESCDLSKEDSETFSRKESSQSCCDSEESSSDPEEHSLKPNIKPSSDEKNVRKNNIL